MTKYYVLPYTTGSHGALMIADELDGKRIKLTGSTYSPKPDHVIINWGNGNCQFSQALNAKINDVINKVDFFKRLVGCTSVPKFAFTKAGATNLSYPVVCRTTVEGHDGQGIVIAETPAQLVNASLYTEYADKTSEYRVHLGRLPNGDVTIICRQKKFKSADFTGDGRIWTGPNTKLDWCDTVPNAVAKAAKEVFSKFPELTFGGFDVVYNNSEERAYVLEINSAPMMTAGTTQKYAEFFKNYTAATPVTVSATEPAPTEAPITQTIPNPATAPTPAPAQSWLTGFVKAQIAAGHISQADLEKYTPPVTEETLISNYITAINQI